MKTIERFWDPESDIDLEILGIQEHKGKIINPFANRTIGDIENPALHLLMVMQNPDYFYFTCKHLFGVKILPFQSVLLKEMWYRPFPMLIGSRGLGKSFLLGVYALLRATFIQGRKIVITGAGFRQSKIILQYMENIWKASPVLRSLFKEDPTSGPHHDADKWEFRLGNSTVTALPIGDGCVSPFTLTTYGNCFGRISDYATPENITQINKSVWGNGKFRRTNEAYNNGVKPTKKVATRKGFSFEGTHNHAMKIVRDAQVMWVRADQMEVGDRIMIDRSERWHKGTTSIKPSEAYCAGLLVGDGNWTNERRIGFATSDQESADRMREFFGAYGWKLRWAGENDPLHYVVDSASAHEWFIDYFGIKGDYGHTKQFPAKIMGSDRETVRAFISGLYDADGHVVVTKMDGGTGAAVGFTNTSERLVEELQYILLHFGIVSHRGSRKRKENKNWRKVHELLITGPNAVLFAEKIGFRLSRKQNKLCGAIAAKKRNYSKDGGIPDVADVMIDIVSRNRVRQDKNYSYSPSKIKKKKSITHDYASKFLDFYGHLDEPGLETIKTLNSKDVFYDEIVSIEDGECHTYDIHVPDGNEYCANGFFSHNSKIRGYRAHDLICDEFASVPHELFETVISGFSVVNIDPVDKVWGARRRQVMEARGVDVSEFDGELSHFDLGNQTVISGTGFWQFNHFATYWKKWKGIIESKGDPEIITRIHNGEPQPELDHRDYAIYRIPVELLPNEYMDLKQIARSRATVHRGIYINEYGACSTPDTLVTTDRGVKRIVDIDVGDMVLTHKGRFRRVTETMSRPYKGPIISYATKGCGVTSRVTPEHPYWFPEGEEWRPLEEVTVGTNLVNLTELSGRQEFRGTPLDRRFGLVVGRWVAEGFNYGEDDDDLVAATCIGEGDSLTLDPAVLYSNEEFLRGFIVGYWDGGRMTPGGRRTDSANLDILVQLRTALSYFGISTSLFFGRRGRLSLSRINQVKFHREFYERGLPCHRPFFENDGLHTHLPFTRREVAPYDGLVYNFEVEEDNSYSFLNATVHNCFSSDSNGFFRRSLIETCVTTNPVQPVGSGMTYSFSASLRGDPNCKYIYGVDTASEADRFAIVVLEVHPDHRRIVYCWTTTRKEFGDRVQVGVTGVDSFHNFCAQKLRELMRLFPCELIAMDSQGGGRHVLEALHDPDKMTKDELPLWEISEFHPLCGKSKPSDDFAGLHIVEMVNFADNNYTSMSNHGMKKDFEDRKLLFPAFDAIVIQEAAVKDSMSNRIHDTLEDCVYEIEHLKEELATIVFTQTANGRDRFSTPEVKQEGSKKGRLRKDRYSALVMANAAARRLDSQIEPPPYVPTGGFVGSMERDRNAAMYASGPEWFMKEANQNVAVFSRILRR